MTSEQSHTEIQETLNRLEAKIDKVDRTLNPPFWIKLLRWISRNIFTILLLVIIIIFSIKAFALYQDIRLEIEEIKSVPTQAAEAVQESIRNSLDKIKFW